MHIHRALKFPAHHSAPVTRIKLRLIESRFLRVPNEPTESMGVTFTVTVARPGRDVAGVGTTVPNQGLAISRVWVTAFAAREFDCPHEQRAANQKQSSSH